MGETAKRILVAVPLIIVVIAIIVLGGSSGFAAALAVFGCLDCASSSRWPRNTGRSGSRPICRWSESSLPPGWAPSSTC